MPVSLYSVPAGRVFRRKASARKTRINPIRQGLRDSTVRLGEQVTKHQLQKAGWVPLQNAVVSARKHKEMFMNYQGTRGAVLSRGKVIRLTRDRGHYASDSGLLSHKKSLTPKR